MTRAASALVRLGDLVDALTGHIRRTPGSVRRALSSRRHHRIGLAIALGYLIVYLAAIGDLKVSPEGQFGRFADPPEASFVADWTERVFAERAPFLFEPVATIYPVDQLAIFVSPANLLVGGTLALLLGLGMAVTLYAGWLGARCRRGATTQLLGAMPAFLIGFSCCAPSFILLLGTNVAAAILPAFIPLRSWLVPLAMALMAGMLVWGSRRLVAAEQALIEEARAEPAAAAPTRVPV